MERSRVTADERRQLIIEAFLTVAKRRHYNAVRRADVAFEARVSEGLITRYFDQSMHTLREQAVAYAVVNEVVPIITQAVVVGDIKAGDLSSYIAIDVVNYVKGLV
jgi:DNA-binding transcriptional regulator YbjK